MALYTFRLIVGREHQWHHALDLGGVKSFAAVCGQIHDRNLSLITIGKYRALNKYFDTVWKVNFSMETS